MIKKLLKIAASLLLLLNAIAALYGGGNLIIHPDGSSMQMSLDWLKHTPFHNYLIPGIILFIANGLFSISVLGVLHLRPRLAPWFVMSQGAILTGWIFIQILMVQILNPHHLVFGFIGIVLIIIGWLLRKYNYE